MSWSSSRSPRGVPTFEIIGSIGPFASSLTHPKQENENCYTSNGLRLSAGACKPKFWQVVAPLKGQPRVGYPIYRQLLRGAPETWV
jgi:hypothetical protein